MRLALRRSWLISVKYFSSATNKKPNFDRKTSVNLKTLKKLKLVALGNLRPQTKKQLKGHKASFLKPLVGRTLEIAKVFKKVFNKPEVFKKADHERKTIFQA